MTKCSVCDHPIGDHYPNFAKRLPISFYCGKGGAASGCDCVRDVAEIVYRNEADGRVVAEREAE